MGLGGINERRVEKRNIYATNLNEPIRNEEGLLFIVRDNGLLIFNANKIH